MTTVTNRASLIAASQRRVRRPRPHHVSMTAAEPPSYKRAGEVFQVLRCGRGAGASANENVPAAQPLAAFFGNATRRRQRPPLDGRCQNWALAIRQETWAQRTDTWKLCATVPSLAIVTRNPGVPVVSLMANAALTVRSEEGADSEK